MLLKVSDVARLLNLSSVTIRRLMDRGELPYCSIGRTRRIAKSDVEALVLRHTVGKVQNNASEEPSRNVWMEKL